jgi:hypothetical protein
MHIEEPVTGLGAVMWAIIFGVAGLLVAFFLVPIISLVQRGRVSWINAARLAVVVAFFCVIPIRAIESLVVYHAPFREGWWPALWGAVYALAFAEGLRWSYNHWRRMANVVLDEDGYEEKP